MKLNFSIRNLAAAVCAAAGLASISTSAIAGPISVLNASFENPVQQAPGYNLDGTITSWVTSLTSGSVGGVWNPSLSSGGFSAYWSTALPDGNQVAFTSGGTIAQTLTTTYASGSLYNLTVAVGSRLDGGGSGYIPTNVTMKLFAGTTGNIVATLPINVGLITRGRFQDFTLSYVADGPSNGQAIGILFTSTGQQLDIDNVRLSNSVPEPGTLILLGGALAGISMVRRRKQA